MSTRVTTVVEVTGSHDKDEGVVRFTSSRNGAVEILVDYNLWVFNLGSAEKLHVSLEVAQDAPELNP